MVAKGRSPGKRRRRQSRRVIATDRLPPRLRATIATAQPSVVAAMFNHEA